MKKTMLYSLLFFCSSALSSTSGSELAIEVNVKNNPNEQQKATLVLYQLQQNDGSFSEYNELVYFGKRVLLRSNDIGGANIRLEAIDIPKNGRVSFTHMARSCTIDYPELYAKYLGVLEINLEYKKQTKEWSVECNPKAVVKTKNETTAG